MAERICTVDGCGRTYHCKGYCKIHYERLRKYGRLDLVRTPPRPTGRGICTVDDCDKVDCGTHGLCFTHYYRLKKFGDTSDSAVPIPDRSGTPRAEASPYWVGEEATYNTMHCRVRKYRGSASLLDCVDCGQIAVHWSYDHADPDERHQDGMAYSTDLNHYEPRCASCHVRFDREAATA